MKSILITLVSFGFLNSACAGTQKTKITVTETTTTTTESTVKKGLPTTKITLVMENVDVREVLKMLFEEGKVSYTLSSTLSKTPFSAKFNDVPFSEALNAIVASVGYDYSVDKAGIVHVVPGVIKKAK